MRKKQRFLSFLRDVPQKVWENSVFYRFPKHFVQNSQKKRKTAFLELFARRSSKRVRIQCFFTFFETLCTKFAKYAKNRVFWAFCAKFRQQCEKTAFFHVFLNFLRDVLQNVWENSVFSRFSRQFVQSSQNMRKTEFFELFALSSASSARKQRFFTFF